MAFPNICGVVTLPHCDWYRPHTCLAIGIHC
jgi:hypothetical protein